MNFNFYSSNLQKFVRYFLKKENDQDKSEKIVNLEHGNEICQYNEYDKLNPKSQLFLGRHMYGRPHNFLIDEKDEEEDDEPLSSFFSSLFSFFNCVFFICVFFIRVSF